MTTRTLSPSAVRAGANSAIPYVIAVLLAFVVSGVLIAMLGHDPFAAFQAILTSSFKSSFGFVETVQKWVPLVLLALGFTIPLAAGKYNIGGEGQLLVGATAAAGVGIVPMVALLPAILIGPVLFDQDGMVYFAFLLSGALYWLLYRTNLGLKVRSVGENPKAADSLGINVSRIRIVTATVGASLMALAGAYLPMVYTGTYTEGIVSGRGWLAIALAFFGGWRPQYILAGATFFAGMEVLALRVQVAGVAVPHQFVSMLPYIATLLVMMFAMHWARIPAFLGRNYDRESRTAH